MRCALPVGLVRNETAGQTVGLSAARTTHSHTESKNEPIRRTNKRDERRHPGERLTSGSRRVSQWCGRLWSSEDRARERMLSPLVAAATRWRLSAYGITSRDCGTHDGRLGAVPLEFLRERGGSGGENAVLVAPGYLSKICSKILARSPASRRCHQTSNGFNTSDQETIGTAIFGNPLPE